ncbi:MULTISPECIES: PIN domain-containing protein [Streptomyces]|uniref:PIN domain-containing protein n=1 Tax=Streptomyces TaxID=1883 RepID=UPI002555987A|nr:PIN domain-containing protein [Streptomyces sp. NBRC 13847]
MLIFDTNAVHLLPPGGPRADILRKLRQSGHHRVAVPWMVMEEMAAHQAKFYPDKHRAVVTALEKLRDALPWELESALEPLDLERLLDHWRGVYGEIFENIETSGESARKALSREATSLPPAKRAKDHSEGARDVAIWFSILEFLRENPDEHVCFVTNNTADFGDGVVYPYPMNEDVRGLEDRLTRLTDFSEVVSQFTKEVSGADAAAAAEELLRSLSVRERVAQTAVEVLNSPTGFTGRGAADATEEWREWLGSPEVELLSVADVTGHEIEGDVWYTANARWVLYGLAVNGDEAGARYVACVWQMKLLFSTTTADEAPTLLATAEPSPPDTDDEPCMTILRGLKQRVASLTASAKKDLLAAYAPAERLLAEQLSASMPKLDVATSPMQRFTLQLAATQAQLYNHSTQRFARQMAATQAQLYDGPVQRLAQQIAATQAQLYANPAQRLARELAASIPKLDIATALPQMGAIESIAASLPKRAAAPVAPPEDENEDVDTEGDAQGE